MSNYSIQLSALHDAIVEQRPSQAAPFIYENPLCGLSAELRVSIYAEGYLERLSAATSSDFPALGHYIGEARLRAAAHAYVRATPSTHWDLNLYPSGFAAFLARELPDGAACALALLEAQIARVFWLPETPALTPEMLQALGEGIWDARLMLRTASTLLVLPYAANAYLTAFRVGNAPAMIEQGREELLVLRHHNEVKRLVLEPAEAMLLHSIQEGQSLGGALTSSTLPEEELAGHLPHYLSRWLGAGVFQALAHMPQARL